MTTEVVVEISNSGGETYLLLEVEAKELWFLEKLETMTAHPGCLEPMIHLIRMGDVEGEYEFDSFKHGKERALEQKRQRQERQKLI